VLYKIFGMVFPSLPFFSLHFTFLTLHGHSAYLSNDGVEKQETKKSKKHNGAVETQHGI